MASGGSEQQCSSMVAGETRRIQRVRAPSHELKSAVSGCWAGGLCLISRNVRAESVSFRSWVMNRGDDEDEVR